MKPWIVALLFGLTAVGAISGLADADEIRASLPQANPETGLTSIAGCLLIPEPWADGDSFRVRLPDGDELTVRLYGVDCIEWHVTDENDARRLWAQRRYFGISRADSTESIELAKSYGERAALFVQEHLNAPFTVHTAFADGRGDQRFRRVYAFITTAAGEDLGALLVRHGLARAFGVSRMTPDGRHRDDYRGWLRDVELAAASQGQGVWAHTDWDSLPEERRDERREAELLARSQGLLRPPEAPLDLNTASLDELMRLPGIGETLAQRLVEARPYARVEDVLNVSGIGPVLLERLRPYAEVAAKPETP